MKETANSPVAQTETSETVIAQQPARTRILALTDFSHRSRTAVEYAVQLAKSMHARLTLLHVLPPPSAFDYTMEGLEAAKKLRKQQALKPTTEKLIQASAPALTFMTRL